MMSFTCFSSSLHTASLINVDYEAVNTFSEHEIRTRSSADAHCSNTFPESQNLLRHSMSTAIPSSKISAPETELPDPSNAPDRPRQGSLIQAVKHASCRMGGPCESEKELRMLGVLPEPEEEQGEVRIPLVIRNKLVIEIS